MGVAVANDSVRVDREADRLQVTVKEAEGRVGVCRSLSV